MMYAIQQQTNSGIPIKGIYNVWSLPPTRCVAWGLKAETAEDAVKKTERKEFLDLKHDNGKPMFNSDGMMLDEKGNRSIFDDVDE